jgi:hypothetical protein
MKKDIFIDNNIASKFSNPQDKEYIKLTKWLLTYDFNDAENKNNYAHLVVSKKLLVEYIRSNQNSFGGTSIPSIVAELQKQGRLTFKSNEEIKDFKEKYFTKTVEKKLKSNNEDREHIPVVLLSDRKFALSLDENFIYDLLNFKGHTVTVKKKPQDLNYEE